MKIVVCVKHVPSEQSHRRLENGRIVRGEEDGLNELDEYAIEAAVTLAEGLREGGADVEVVALTLGPAGSAPAVRRALQVGADRGIVVTDERAAGADVVATARVLAAAVRTIGDVDLVVTGLNSSDGWTAMLPSALGAALDAPVLDNATDLSLDPQAATVSAVRSVPQAVDRLTLGLPAVVAVSDQANTPRHPNMKAMLAAKKKPVETWDLEQAGLPATDGHVADVTGAEQRVRVVASAEVPPRTPGTIIPDAGDGGRLLAQWLRDNGYAGPAA